MNPERTRSIGTAPDGARRAAGGRRGRPRGPIRLTCALALAFVLISCGGPVRGAAKTIQTLSRLPYVGPPPGSVLLGRHDDHGDTNGTTGRQAGIEVVYASKQSRVELDAYYFNSFPNYHVTDSCCNADSVDEWSAYGPAGGGLIAIRVGEPYIFNPPNVTTEPAPPGYNTYITVYVTGPH